MGVCFHGGPVYGKHGGMLFLTAYEIKIYTKIYVLMPCKQVSLTIGAPMANLERICWPGLLERKG
jgi:hypothetical protein